MAFIDKKDPVVLNIKLTSKGRELLSEGGLNFEYYAIGDSEMDYEFNAKAKLFNPNYSPFYSYVLRPADKNPSLLSFISRNLSGDPYNLISNVPSTPTIIQNTAPPLGFFIISSGSTTFITDSDHVKQPDAMAKISGVTGGKQLRLYKAPTYIANVNEPSNGDLLLVKWTNPLGVNTTGYTVNANYPTPYLIYKIQDIVSGTLAANNLIIEVDRNLPDFSDITGGTNNKVAGAMIYYNYINYTGTTIFNDYSTTYENDAVLAFLQNCQCPTITFPFWNMSIVYTDEIAGVQPSGRTYAQYKSNIYGGFVSYIQNQAPVIKKLGVIHYTNSSPSNTYGEQLYQNTPTLNLPSIMWHKSPNKQMGLKLKAYGSVKSLTGTTKSLNTTYYDLADLQGNVVGKVFTDLQLFVIEDQELLFAMSYKSNRSWTLPNYAVGINDNIIIGCPTNNITFGIDPHSPTTVGGHNGFIFLTGITGNIGDMVLEILSGTTFSGATHRIVYQPLVPIAGTYIKTGLVAGFYRINIYDLGTPNNSYASGTTVLTNPVVNLMLNNFVSTPSGLDSDFPIVQLSPTSIRINQSDIGMTFFPNPQAAVKPYGVAPGIGDWGTFAAGQVNFNSLTFTSSYSVYVRDYSGNTNFVVTKGYVAAGNPLNASFNTSQSFVGGIITVSNYLTTIVPSINPIVSGAVIEICMYLPSSVPLDWVAGGTSGTGTPVALVAVSPGTYRVAVRERRNNIVMYTVEKTITVHG